MAALTPLTLSDAQALFEGYGPVPGGVRDVAVIPTGTVNSSYSVFHAGTRRFVRIYEEQGFEGARAEATRLGLLASRGVRTPPPIERLDGALVGSMHGKPVVVFPWRDGESRCLARVSREDAERVGRALAELHLAGRDVDVGTGRFEPEHLPVRLERIAAAPFSAIAEQAEPLRAKLSDWAARRDPALPRGLVHGDLFRDNVLWGSNGEVSALLDFESASLGVLAYDLMVTVLAWSFRDDFDRVIASAMFAGYEAVRPLSPAERAGLLAEGCVAALRFTITRLTDAELRAAEAGVPPRPDKDWKRFAARLAALEAMGSSGLRDLLGGQR